KSLFLRLSLGLGDASLLLVLSTQRILLCLHLCFNRQIELLRKFEVGNRYVDDTDSAWGTFLRQGLLDEVSEAKLDPNFHFMPFCDQLFRGVPSAGGLYYFLNGR